LAVAGLIVIYSAPKIVKKYKLDEKKEIDPQRTENLNEEGIEKFKFDSAVLDVKIKGILIALPGFLVILILFKL
jgi:hypothetical protein